MKPSIRGRRRPDNYTDNRKRLFAIRRFFFNTLMWTRFSFEVGGQEVTRVVMYRLDIVAGKQH